MDRTVGSVPLLPARCQERKLIGEREPYTSITGPDRTGPDPDHLPGGTQFVEHHRAIARHAGWEDVGFDRRSDERRA